MRNEAQKASRRKYEQSEKGKAAKRRHEAAYIASGGRATAEERRKAKPISEARKQAKKKWAANNKDYFSKDRAIRRSLERNLSKFDRFVLDEAFKLAKLRESALGSKWEVDHIVPVSKGGTAVFDNIQVVPQLWNKRKSNLHTQRFYSA